MDLISIPITFDREHTGNRYRIVIAASKRAKELYRGAEPKIKVKNKKLTTTTLEEILSGNVQVLSGDESKACIEAMKREAEHMLEEGEQKRVAMKNATRFEKLLRDLFGTETVLPDKDF
jgi:DNA-directed RNA polymerase omega subunit